MKYKLTNETITHLGRTLYRIQALKDFSNVKKGDLGGYIQSEYNLAQTGDCWVYDNAMVYGKALVYVDGVVCDNARVYGEAMVYGNGIVCDNARVSGEVMVSGEARVSGEAKVSGEGYLRSNVEVKESIELRNWQEITNKVDLILYGD